MWISGCLPVFMGKTCWRKVASPKMVNHVLTGPKMIVLLSHPSERAVTTVTPSLTHTLCAFTQAKTEYLHEFGKLLLSIMFVGSGHQQFKGNMFCLGCIDLLFSSLGAKRHAGCTAFICHIWSWGIWRFLRGDQREDIYFASVGFRHSWGTRKLCSNVLKCPYQFYHYTTLITKCISNLMWEWMFFKANGSRQFWTFKMSIVI